MRRYLNIEFKSYEIWTEDLNGPGVFTITERVKGHPHVISFDVKLCEKLISFLQRAKDAGKEVALREMLFSQTSKILDSGIK